MNKVIENIIGGFVALEGYWFNYPSWKKFASLYNERAPVPQIITHSIKDGVVDTSSAVSVEGRSGLIRELEVGVCMDIDTAEKLRDWLDSQIKQHAKFMKNKKEA